MLIFVKCGVLPLCVCVCVSVSVDPQFVCEVQHHSGQICNKTLNGNNGLMITSTVLSLKRSLDPCMVISNSLLCTQCKVSLEYIGV